MAYEDFTTYTEFDEFGDVTVDSATKVSWDTFESRKSEAYLYKDKGVNHFSGDFTHKFEAYFSRADGFCQVIFWMVSNTVGDFQSLIDANGDGVLFWQYDDIESLRISIYENGVGIGDNWAAPGPQLSTIYFIEVVRDDDGGASGTGRYTIYIRTGSHSGALQDTLVLDCSAGEQNDFRYIFGMAGRHDSSWSGVSTGYTQNLDIGAAVGYTITADSGTFTVTGTAASLLHDKILPSESGVFAIAGSDATFTKGLTLSADSGSFILTGQDVELKHNKILEVEVGSFVITGSDAVLSKSKLPLLAEAGSFVITGQDANLSYMPIIQTGWKADKDLGPWAFTPQPNKPHYNEGNLISGADNPVWEMDF